VRLGLAVEARSRGLDLRSQVRRGELRGSVALVRAACGSLNTTWIELDLALLVAGIGTSMALPPCPRQF
jgi:hypothetical protein